MIQKFDQFNENLSDELIDIFQDLEYDGFATDVKCINFSKCLLSTCQLAGGNLYMTFRNNSTYFTELQKYLDKINKTQDVDQSIDTLKFLYGSVKKMTYTEQNGILTWNHLSIQTSFAEKVNKLFTYSKNIYIVSIQWTKEYCGSNRNIINRCDVLEKKINHIKNFNWESIENLNSIKGSGYFTDNIFLYKSIS